MQGAAAYLWTQLSRESALCISGGADAAAMAPPRTAGVPVQDTSSCYLTLQVIYRKVLEVRM